MSFISNQDEEDQFDIARNVGQKIETTRLDSFKNQ